MPRRLDAWDWLLIVALSGLAISIVGFCMTFAGWRW